jgi:hypothetical protein
VRHVVRVRHRLFDILRSQHRQRNDFGAACASMRRSRLSARLVGLLDSERRNLHVRIDIDNTLDFRINSWYRDASTGDTVPVTLPAAREASADVCDMLKEGKILLCGHSVRATTIDLLQRLEERTKALCGGCRLCRRALVSLMQRS